MSGNYRLALKYIRPLAKQGHSKAQSALARMYETGRELIVIMKKR